MISGIARTKFAKVLAGRQSVKVVMNAFAALTESRLPRLLAATLVQVNLCSMSTGGLGLHFEARLSAMRSLFASPLVRCCDFCYFGFFPFFH